MFYYFKPLGSASVTSRSKYVLDPSVQSNSSYGQAPNMYTAPCQTFGQQQPTYGTSSFSQPFNPSFNQPVSNQMPIASMGQSSIMNPQPINSFAPGLPPIEVAQPAMQQNIQRNPTPPPGWNDPPALKSHRAVRRIHFILIQCKRNRNVDSIIFHLYKQYGK